MTSLSDTFLTQLAKAQEASLQRFGLKVIADVAEADEPIQLADAYDHLRITHDDSNGSDDDAWLLAMIPAAREYCERFLGRALAPRTLELATNSFPTITVDTAPSIVLPFGPVQSITSVKYLVEQDVEDSNGDPVLDSNGDPETEVVELTLGATYELDSYVTPNRVLPISGESWPTGTGSLNSVKVRYVTGYVGEPDSDGNLVLPKILRAAMLLMLGHFYENREAVTPNQMQEMPMGVQTLLEMAPDRERLGML